MLGVTIKIAIDDGTKDGSRGYYLKDVSATDEALLFHDIDQIVKEWSQRRAMETLEQIQALEKMYRLDCPRDLDAIYQ